MKKLVTFTYRVCQNFMNYSGGIWFYETHLIDEDVNFNDWQKDNLNTFQNGDFKLISIKNA